MATDETLEVLKRLDRSLSLLVAFTVDERARSSGSKARHRSTERILSECGLSLSEIGALLGKSKQAVQQSLKAEARTGGNT